MINRGPGAPPLYRQLADLLRRAIADGDYAPGQDLPSEAALAHAHGLGRDTVRDALAVLRNEGLVVSERGRPSFVADPGEITQVTLHVGDRAESRGRTVTVHRANGTAETYQGTVRIVSAP